MKIEHLKKEEGFKWWVVTEIFLLVITVISLLNSNYICALLALILSELRGIAFLIKSDALIKQNELNHEQ